MTKSTADASPTPEDPRAVVAHVAGLARLDIGEAEIHDLGDQFGRILQAFQALTDLDVEGVEPMTGPADLTDVKRDDTERPCLTPDEILAAAPERIEDFYSVPKTIGGDA